MRRIHHRCRHLVVLIAVVIATGAVACAQPERVSPLSQGAVELPRLGQMIGTIHRAVRGGTNESFGRQIYPLGDVDGDSLADWIVARDRCDTLIYTIDGRGYYPKELLLFRGRRASLPDVASGTLIGPTEIGAETRLITSGDFDGDGHPDLVVAIWVYGDTTSKNLEGWSTHNLVVVWGNNRGEYSLDDTSRLTSEAAMWGDIHAGVTADLNGDGHVDLLVTNSNGLTDGKEDTIPKMHLFKGIPGGRWGRDGVGRNADWTLWKVPEYSTMTFSFAPRLEVLDQDCDGANDLIFYSDSYPFPSRLTVLYGRAGGGWPDTLDQEVVEPGVINGRSALFSDVTGDGTPDLLFNCGGHATVRIYAGRPGQRLRELYGNGRDEPPDGVQWWAKPWAELWTPDHLNDSWTLAGFTPPRKLGDASFDGRDEIWLFSYPYVLGYLMGPTMDSLADAWVRVPGEEMCAGVRLGDIDGSGRITYAFGFDDVEFDVSDPFPGGVIYVTAGPGLLQPYEWDRPRPMPHVPGEQCRAVSSAPPGERRSGTAGSRATTVHATFDRGTGTATVSWDGVALAGAREVAFYSVYGECLARRSLVRDASHASIELGPIAPAVIICVVVAESGRGVALLLTE